MYLHSKVEDNIKMPQRVTRAVTKIAVAKKATRCTGKKLNSSFYKGTVLWNDLDVELQKIGNVKLFVEGIKKYYRNYQEIW